MLRGQTFLNNSFVAMNNIGDGETNALLCVTNNPDCCKPPPQGEFYYPNSSAVGFSITNSLYRNRGSQVVRLNRRGSTPIPSGIYRCAIPDSDNISQNSYINIISGILYVDS